MPGEKRHMMPKPPVLQKPRGMKILCPITLKEEESFSAAVQVSEETTCKGSPVAFPWSSLAVIQGISKEKERQTHSYSPQTLPRPLFKRFKSIAIPACTVTLAGQQRCERFGHYCAHLVSPEPLSFSLGI